MELLDIVEGSTLVYSLVALFNGDTTRLSRRRGNREASLALYRFDIAAAGAVSSLGDTEVGVTSPPPDQFGCRFSGSISFVSMESLMPMAL